MSAFNSSERDQEARSELDSLIAMRKSGVYGMGEKEYLDQKHAAADVLENYFERNADGKYSPSLYAVAVTTLVDKRDYEHAVEALEIPSEKSRNIDEILEFLGGK